MAIDRLPCSHYFFRWPAVSFREGIHISLKSWVFFVRISMYCGRCPNTTEHTLHIIYPKECMGLVYLPTNLPLNHHLTSERVKFFHHPKKVTFHRIARWLMLLIPDSWSFPTTLNHQWLAEGTSRILRELDMRDFNHHDEERMDGKKTCWNDCWNG